MESDYSREIEVKCSTDEKVETTCSYDATTRVATIDSGTWPTWALYGFVVLDGRRPQITAVSDDLTEITLDENAPTSNSLTGTAVEIARDNYELPTGARKNFDLLNTRDQTSPWVVRYVPEQFVTFIDRTFYWRYSSTTADLPLPYFDDPQFFTIGRDDRYDSGYSIRFAHIPDSSYPYSFSYFREPRQLKHYKKVAVVDVSSNTVTFPSDFVVTADMEGSVIRISENSNEPTSLWGSPETDLNPFEYQRVLTNVTTGAGGTADLEGGGDDVTARSAVVSDPLDIDYEVMQSMFTAAVDSLFAQRQQREDAGNLEMMFRREVGLAKEYDENFRRNRGQQIFGAF